VENRTRQGIFSADIAWPELAEVYKKAALPAEFSYSKYHNSKQLIIPFKMTTRFITYVPKPTKTKDSSKPLCKSTLKEFSTSDSNQLPTRNPLPVKVSAMENDFLIQKANGNDGIMVQGTPAHYIYRC
jgi:hypothetical protein